MIKTQVRILQVRRKTSEVNYTRSRVFESVSAAFEYLETTKKYRFTLPFASLRGLMTSPGNIPNGLVSKDGNTRTYIYGAYSVKMECNKW